MKQILIVISLFFATILTSKSQAQIAADSWSFGFGGVYPRLMNHSLSSTSEINYGGYFSFQRNFSESVALRIKPKYSHLEGKYGSPELISKTEAISLNFDIIYYFVPCDPVSPYITFGAAPMVFLLSNQADPTIDDFNISGQFNLGLGCDFKIGHDWSFVTDFNYHTVFDDKLDGNYGSGLGGLLTANYDSYFSFDVGFNYYFSKGLISQKCTLPGGVTEVVFPEQEKVDYGKIEQMIKRNIPRVITKEVVVDKPPMEEKKPEPAKKWVLDGVTFNSGSSNLTNASYPVLYNVIDILKNNPAMMVEIGGHTDSDGSANSNMRLSEMRAQAVKDFLVTNGISSARLFVKGYGETQPIGDNYTALGRAINRRIEFTVISK